MTLEAPILQDTLIEGSRLGLRLFRNNRGFFYTLDGMRKVKAGLLTDGASDCIGIMPVTITLEMVGKTIGVFAAVETKKSTWTKPKTDGERDQAKFIDFVRKFGGFATFLTNPQDLKKRVDEYLSSL